MSRFNDISMNSITGEPVAFSGYKGKVCLVVNVASK
jgi:glutathione peroxidase-family protein